MKQNHAEQRSPSPESIVTPIRQRFRLRTTLVVPFVLQLIVAVGLVGYLSFRSSQRAVDTLATQLRNERQRKSR